MEIKCVSRDMLALPDPRAGILTVSCEVSFQASVVFSGQLVALCVSKEQEVRAIFSGGQADGGRWAHREGQSQNSGDRRGCHPHLSLACLHCLQVGTGTRFLILSSAKSEEFKKCMC